MRHKGFKIGTINTRKQILTGFWSYLKGERYVKSNVVKDIPANTFEKEDPIIKVPGDEDIDKFIDNIQMIGDDFYRTRNYAIVELLIGSGMRKSELIGLDMKDLHLDDAQPTVDILAKGKLKEVYKRNVWISPQAKISIHAPA